MTLEDFEKSLAEEREAEERIHTKEENESKHRKHHHHRHHHKRRHHLDDGHNRKRARRSTSVDSVNERTIQPNDGNVEDSISRERRPEEHSLSTNTESGHSSGLQRDSWMHMPSRNDIDFTQKGTKQPSMPRLSRPSEADFKLKIHDNELNKHHLQDLADGKVISEQDLYETAQHEFGYVFGDAGSQWRMTKLKAVFRQAEDSEKSVEAVAIDHYGDLRAFDDAREEQTELDRRETYGPGYVGKEKPSGDLFAERKLDEGARRNSSETTNDAGFPTKSGPSVVDTQPPTSTTGPLDHTTLNRLKARMMKAKLRGASDAPDLEAEYNTALASSVNTVQSDVITLGTMDNRMLAGGRYGEVRNVDTKRGRERGLVEENEDMSIEDMVREERRTKYQVGGEGQRFAERIAKDAKYDVSASMFPAMV